MWLIMLSANLQAIYVPLLGHTSDEKINEEGEGRAVANHRFRWGNAMSDEEWVNVIQRQRYTAGWVRSPFIRSP
jgi:hypothetical protein